MDIRERLIELSENGYRKFTSSLIPNIEEERILGIRIPVLRQLAKDLEGTDEENSFLSALPHHYLDENNLHALMISNMKDTRKTLERIDTFLSFVDNWETSDIMNPKSFGKDLELTGIHAHNWLHGNEIYRKRYAITTFMKYFLEPDSLDSVAMEEISKLENEDHYVRMAAAWYWSEAMVKNPERALSYMESDKLDPWIRNKGIQKALESFRVNDELKQHLRDIR